MKGTTRRAMMSGSGVSAMVLCCAAVMLAAALGGPVAAQNRAGAISAGVRVYSSDIHDPGETDLGGPPRIAIVGTPNGSFSGKVVVASAQGIDGLQARMSVLKQGDAVIPVSRIAVRYGVPWDGNIGSWTSPPGSDRLYESPPASFSPRRSGGAVAPVWVTVAVPKEAKPGTYTGKLAIKTKRGKPVTVPVKLEVQDWILPDTQRWRTWVEMIQSPETLVAEYGIPFWSDDHWRMIARSMKMIGQTGSRVVYVPLICYTNQGHEQSMVRWIPKGKGKYEHDFSIMDKYLDLAEENMGKPKLVIFYVWEVYLKPPKQEVVIKEGDSSFVRMEKEKAAARWALRDKGPAVTVVDPKTGKIDVVRLPRYTDTAGKALWQPLWSKLRKRMQKRGLADKMMLGVVSDARPTKEEVTVLDELSGGLEWTSCSHHARWVMADQPPEKPQLYQIARVGYAAVALDFQFTINPAKGRRYGWKKPMLHSIYWRFQFFNTSSSNTVRTEAERNITGNQRGIGHLGGDFWFCIRNKRDNRVGTVAERYPESYWHSLNIRGWMLGPGPKGPVATRRFELFREGIQECEARIAIEAALTEPKRKARLGKDLAKRAQDVLDERQIALWKGRGATEADFAHGFVPQYREIYAMSKKWDAKAGNKWFIDSGWQGRAAKLYATAAEVQRKLGTR